MLTINLWGQDLTTDDLYKQAMENAKVAFGAEQYSTAVMFYREAQRIKPSSHLPRYKIEDIRTIYIANELDTIAIAEPLQVDEKPKKQKKKEVEAEQLAIKTLAEEQATDRMNEDAEKQKQELADLKIETQILIVVEGEVSVDEIEIEDTERTLETGLKKMDKTTSSSIEGPKVMDPNIKGEKREVASAPVVEEVIVPVSEPKPESVIKKEEAKVVAKPKPKPKPTPLKEGMSADEKAIWVAKEKKRLAEVYPNKKTIEEIQKPGKHITRVIMHIDGKVTVYLKVKHSWATYFFIDEPGQALKSINQQYFNLKTNLKTYGY